MSVLRLNNPVPRWIHAYSQAPWRVQRQWIGIFLLGVVGLAMVASLYLDVTSQAAISGREIQDMSSQIDAIQQSNSDLQAQLATMTSTSTMETRAKSLGYAPVDASQIIYVIVPGYVAPKPSLLMADGALRPSAPSIPPEYTESLIAWLSRKLQTTSGNPYGAMP